MRKSGQIPRIIKLNEVKDFSIYCAFNNGEHRIIDFIPLFKKWNIQNDLFSSKLLIKDEFNQVKLHEGTLQWPNMVKKTILSNGMEFEVMFDLDPIVLFENSDPDEERNKNYKIGHLIKTARKEAGLTQEELAKRSGTTKNYISRIENNRSDIELRTLRKIIEIGLGKKLDLQVT